MKPNITMVGDMSAFASLVFGYFFFWTIHADFPPEPSIGPGVAWPVTAALLCLASWALTLLARRNNRLDRQLGFYLPLGLAALLTVATGAALFAGPYVTGLDPTSHVYPATVWVLVLWSLLHLGIALIMQLYCIARRLAGRMTAEHDIDMQNVTLYWHFMAITVTVTVAVIAGFPRIA